MLVPLRLSVLALGLKEMMACSSHLVALEYKIISFDYDNAKQV
jgi:hypothetical protein